MSRPSFSLGDRVHFERHYDTGNVEQADGLLFTKDYAPGREPWALVTDEGYVKGFSEETAVHTVRSDSAAPVFIPTRLGLERFAKALELELPALNETVLESLAAAIRAEQHERFLRDAR